MKSTVRHLTLISLFLLCAATGNAEKSPVLHRFYEMSVPSQIAYTNYNKTAKTDLLTYTCSDGAEFGVDYLYGTRLSLNLTGYGQMVTTTAVDSLAGVEISFFKETETRTNIELYLSRDSTHWTPAIISDGMYDTKGKIIADFVPGRYYVRIKNMSSSASKKTSLWEIKYRFGGCNCFLYIPEE